MKQETPFLSPDFRRAWQQTARATEPLAPLRVRPQPTPEQQTAAPGFAAARAALRTARERLRSPSRLRTFSALLSTPCPF